MVCEQVNTYWHNPPFKSIHVLDLAKNENEFDTPGLTVFIFSDDYQYVSVII